MWVEQDNVISATERGHIRQVIDGVESQPESASGSRALQLGVLSDAADVLEVGGGEGGVVVGQKSGPLPDCHARPCIAYREIQLFNEIYIFRIIPKLIMVLIELYNTEHCHGFLQTGGFDGTLWIQIPVLTSLISIIISDRDPIPQHFEKYYHGMPLTLRSATLAYDATIMARSERFAHMRSGGSHPEQSWWSNFSCPAGT